MCYLIQVRVVPSCILGRSIVSFSRINRCSDPKLESSEHFFGVASTLIHEGSVRSGRNLNVKVGLRSKRQWEGRLELAS